MSNLAALASITFLVLCLQVQLSDCIEDDDDLADFIYSRIPQLQGQARSSERRQFAAIILLDHTEVEDITQFQFHPHYNDGSPWIDTTLPSMPAEPRNYIVARPENPDHAEEIILRGLANMWNNFMNRGTHGPPAMILLFTRLYPCTTGGQAHNCARQIRDTLQQPPYNTVGRRIVAYNSDDPPVANVDVEDSRFLMVGIVPQGLQLDRCFTPRVLRVTNETVVRSSRNTHDTSDMCAEPSTIQSLQGCVLQCLGTEIHACVKDSESNRQKAYLMNTLIDECLVDENMDRCFRDTFLENTGAACGSLRRQTVAENLLTCRQTCNLKPISKPQQDASDFDINIALMTSTEQRSDYYAPTAFGCKDKRRTGLLCTHLNDEYLTAGNSLCRDDYPCGYYGHDYYWCYTDFSDNWDYCCSDTCGYREYDYLWCNAGSEWQYCGQGGTVTTGARMSQISRPCLADHPCGLHYDVSTSNNYYWCYVDIALNWDYCCSPEPEDNECTYNQGTSYKWCKTTYHKNYVKGGWEHCYY